MTARLFSKSGETRGLEIELETGSDVIVGRDPKSDLVIEHALMSSRHAKISYDESAERFVLEDLESLNGTQLDGDEVAGSERLGHLHVITFAGSYDFFFYDTERGARRHANMPSEHARSAPVEEEAPPPTETTDEVTSVDREPIAMPDFLARRADAIQRSVPTPSEITSIEKQPVGLPELLARKAEEAAKDEAGESEPPPPSEPQHTVREKLPVGLPGILARRSEEVADEKRKPDVQKHETVDLADIEDLIASEEATEVGERESPMVDGLHLIVTESGGKVRRYALTRGNNLVGRGGSATVVLKYPDLSRRHAEITVGEDGKITVRDLGSRNRTFVNDKPLDPDVDVEVQVGTRVRFGSVEARLAKVG